MKQIEKRGGFFTSFDGTKIYYEVRGEGKPIILAYGIGCLMNHWTHQIKTFSDNYQVITFDYRAHHKSESPKNMDDLSLESLVKDLELLMKHLNIENASLWGHSFGVQILVKAYERLKPRINNLVFINGFATNPINNMFGNDVVNHFINYFKMAHKLLPDTIGYLWRVALQSPIAIPMSALAGGFNLQLTGLKDVEIYARGIAAMDLKHFIRLFEEMMRYNGSDALSEITCPALIVAGQQDGVTPLAFQEELHKKIAHSEYMVVPFGSHCTQLDMPDYVNLKIESFFRTLNY